MDTLKLKSKIDSFLNSFNKVAGITSDSRAVKNGSIFIAVRGVQGDGHQHLSQAIQAGAIGIICEEPFNTPGNTGFPILVVEDSAKALGLAAAWFNGNPSERLRIVGVTGTSGKTTTTYLLESIFLKNSEKVGVIGTVNFRYYDAQGTLHILESTHTTPGPVELQALLRQMVDAGVTTVIMEVSSHALKQERTWGISFDGVIFNGLSSEHLDYHPDMEDYFFSKRKLFFEYVENSLSLGKSPVVAICTSDLYGRRLLNETMKNSWSDSARVQIVSFGTGSDCHYSIDQVKQTPSGMEGPIGRIEIRSRLIGGFNALNIAGAIAVTEGLGTSAKVIASGIESLTGIPGRMERVEDSGKPGPSVVVDYAHKPDALEKVLLCLKQIVSTQERPGKIVTVIGCGGDRDKVKRPLMGNIAVRLSGEVIFTSDNPRSEDPERILEEITRGAQGFKNFEVISDRKAAIFRAVQLAKVGDWILIAGKGHENYQIIWDSKLGKSRKIEFDDRKVAKEALSSIYS